MAAPSFRTLYSFLSSMAAPSFRALYRLFCSSARTLSPLCPRSFPGSSFCMLKPGATTVIVGRFTESSATASVHSKVEDRKLTEWSLHEYTWRGPRWWLAIEFAHVRKAYPKIPVEQGGIGMFLEKGQLNKILHATSFNVHSVIVKADVKGQEVTKRTILVMGRDVNELEATANRLNKFRSLFNWSERSYME